MQQCTRYMSYLPFTLEIVVKDFSKVKSKGKEHSGSRSAQKFLPCVPGVQQVHMHEWNLKRPSSKYGCVKASVAVILLFCWIEIQYVKN